MSSELWVCNLGRIAYLPALALQERLRLARQQELIPDTLLALEHNPRVYTRGRRSAPDELTMSPEFYAAQGIEIIPTRRGGKVTYHGPGQLVGYPIVRIEEDVLAYVRLLERALISALAQEGIAAHARPQDGPNYTGVWVGERKIASIGVHVSRGVTMHGFAINVDNDLTPFEWVVACGLPSVRMTSIVEESGTPGGEAGGQRATGASDPDLSSPRLICFRRRVAFALAQELGHRQRLVSLERLERQAAAARSVAV